MGHPASWAITVDLVIFKGNKVLLIQRRNPPFQECWCLPGGHLELGETIKQAAERELKEETELRGVELHLVNVFSEPGRDPRGPYVSVAFYGCVEEGTQARAGDDAWAVRWFDLDRLPEMLGFDHAEILAAAREKRGL